MTSSVLGSNTRAWGAWNIDGQTETMWPALSNASEPQSEGACAPDVACNLRPSGPACW
jgi:hypothetical protein